MVSRSGAPQTRDDLPPEEARRIMMKRQTHSGRTRPWHHPSRRQTDNILLEEAGPDVLTDSGLRSTHVDHRPER